MKRNSLLLSIILMSCDKSDDATGRKESVEYIAHENSALEISENDFGTFVEVVDGDKLVFEYTFSRASGPELADSGLDKYLYFELAANTGDFQLTTNDFDVSNTYLRHSCFCPVTDFRRATSGEITAQKLGNLKWNISFDVAADFNINEGEEEFSETIEFEDSGIFQLK
ncbi:hypothetical protein [uncultured Christiangramia sp.]|uniref:hypothetical protein n=1 Tax=uncultured Christiangramia sp. TaxID=503836 RepID=UPI0025E9668A|nr:hypothetical protein [uncultured Christiangramia sp.]